MGNMLKVRYFLPGNWLNAEPVFTWMHLRENRMHKKVSRARIAWWKTMNPTLAAGRNLSLVLLMQEANLALREAGKEEASQVKGVCNWVTAWKRPWWRTLMAIPWLWIYEWLYRSGGFAIRWSDVMSQGCCTCRRQRSSKPSYVPSSRSFLEPGTQLCKTQTLPSGDPQRWPWWGQSEASVLWALCHVCSGSGRLDSPWHLGAEPMEGLIFEDGAPLCVCEICVHVTAHITALLKVESWNTKTPGRSWWCWKPIQSLAYTSSSFSILFSKVRWLFFFFFKFTLLWVPAQVLLREHVNDVFSGFRELKSAVVVPAIPPASFWTLRSKSTTVCASVPDYCKKSID